MAEPIDDGTDPSVLRPTPSGRVPATSRSSARIERLNWLGDVSAKGIAQSCGLMVNYLYRPDEIEANHEAYRGDRRVAMTSAIRGLIRG